MKNGNTVAIIFALTFLAVGCEKNEDALNNNNNNNQNNNNNNQTGTVDDIDGNTYPTVILGTQEWMAANLKTTRYNDGTTIPNVTDETDWRLNAYSGAYCDYENDPGNVATYGRLYNGYAVNTNNLCPAGWHVPSDAEWSTLEAFLGEESTAGGKLKEADTSHWESPNTAATNETGFTALPGGSRFSTGSFYNLTYTGYWWTSSDASDTSYAWYRFLDFNSGFVLGEADEKRGGLSVRCVKD